MMWYNIYHVGFHKNRRSFFSHGFCVFICLERPKASIKNPYFQRSLAGRIAAFFHWVRTQWWPVSSGCCLILGDFNMGSKMLNRVWILYIYIVWISEVCFQSSKIGISVRRFHYFGMGGSTSNQKMFGNHGKKQTYIRLQRVDGKWSANFQAVQVGRVIRRSGSPSRLWQKRQWQSPASAGATLLWACKQHLPSKP